MLKRALLIVFSTVLAACGGVGVSSYSATSDLVTIVDFDGLYAVSQDGESEIYLSDDVNPHYSSLVIDNQVVFVDSDGQLLAVAPTGGDTALIREERLSPDSGFIFALPSNEVLILDERVLGGTRYAQVIDPATGQIVNQIEGIAGVFITDAAVVARPNEEGWYTPPLADGQLKLIFQAEDDPDLLFLYSADTTGFEFVDVLPRELSEDDQALLALRNLTNLRSGVLTPDGRYLVLHTETETAPITHGLWLIPLGSDAPARNLYTGLGTPPDFAVSPLDNQIAYRSSAGVLEVLDIETGTVTQLPAGAEAPDWR